MHLLYLIFAASLAKIALCQTIAQEIAALPSCSLTCLSNAIASAGCGHTDYACQCGSAKFAIQESATPCLYNVCSANDISTVSSITTKVCEIQNASPAASGSATKASTSTASNSQSTATGDSTPAMTSSSTSNSSKSKKKKGLSTGAAVGSGVGAGVFALLLIAAIVFFVIRYKKRGKELQRLSAAGVVTEAKKTGPQELHSVESGVIPGEEQHPTGGSAVWSHATEVDGREKRGYYGAVELHAQER